MYLAYNTAAIENHNVPAVMLMHQSFSNDARAGVTVKGVPRLRLITTPIRVNVCGDHMEEEIRDGIAAIFDEMVDALTRPLTPEEQNPEPMKMEDQSGVIFKGSLEDVNNFFYKRGWSYGFPVIPPTREAVDKMLEGTDLAPDTVLAKLPPRTGKLTVEKLAINAVMAGALPIHMPVLVAAARTLTQNDLNVEGFLCSVVSGGFFWVVNGPIRHELNFNSGIGLLSPDNRANTAIAATMGLVGKNVGGARPGIEAMSAMGYPGRYSMCIAENEEESPWEPLHVEQGFNKEDNTITVFGSNFWQRLHPYGTDAEGVIRGICYNISIATGHGVAGGFIMPPRDAKLLGDKGWTKKELAAYLAEYARVPAWRHGVVAPGMAKMMYTQFKYRERWPVDEHFQVALLTPERCRFVVAGMEDATIHCYSGKVFGFQYGGGETAKIELPPNWNKLVQKYKDIVPTYSSY